MTSGRGEPRIWAAWEVRPRVVGAPSPVPHGQTACAQLSHPPLASVPPTVPPRSRTITASCASDNSDAQMEMSEWQMWERLNDAGMAVRDPTSMDEQEQRVRTLQEQVMPGLSMTLWHASAPLARSLVDLLAHWPRLTSRLTPPLTPAIPTQRAFSSVDMFRIDSIDAGGGSMDSHSGTQDFDAL